MSQSPKYDTKIRRKGGYQFASETDLEGLEYWHGRACQPASDPKWQDKNDTEAKRLSYWVNYRRAEPLERWRGIRGDGEVVAFQPSKNPKLHSWDAKPAEPVEVPGRGDAWEGYDDDGGNKWGI